MSVLDWIYCLIVVTAIYATLSMEYYSRKVKVSASPSVPWMRRAVIERLVKEVAAAGKPAPVILELGSGFGTLALAAAKACPQAKVIGYDISPVPVLCSRVRAALGGYKNVTFVQKDFRNDNLGHADFVLAYLTVNLMEELGRKLAAELKPGAVVIANTFHIPQWTADEEETVQNFVYTLKVFTYRIKGENPVDFGTGILNSGAIQT